MELPGNRNWLPGVISKTEYNFRVPENMPWGNYQMKFRLVETDDDSYVTINIGLQKKSLGSEKFVNIGFEKL